MRDDATRLRRRYTMLLAVSLSLLAASVVLFFRTDAGITRWLVVIAWACMTMVSWHLRRGTPPAT